MSFNLGVLKLVHVPSGVTHSTLDSFNFGARGIEEILQNARNVLTTPKGTVVLHRDFGVEMSFKEASSLPEAQQLFENELEKLWEFEPRIRRWKLDFNSTASELNPALTSRPKRVGQSAGFPACWQEPTQTLSKTLRLGRRPFRPTKLRSKTKSNQPPFRDGSRDRGN